MNILLSTQSVGQYFGGIPVSVSSVANVLSKKNNVILVTHPTIGKKVELNKRILHSEVKKSIFRNSCLRNNKIDSHNYDIIHHNGLWVKLLYDTLKLSEYRKIPFVISPRGMLDHWSLRKNKKVKKFIAWWAYQKNLLNKVDAFHATSEMEVKSIRKLGFTQPIGLIPNGVSLPLKRKIFRNNKFKKLLYLSRIDKKKNVEILLDVWREQKNINAVLTIAGDGDRSIIHNIKYLHI